VRTLLSAVAESCGTRKEIVMRDRDLPSVKETGSFAENESERAVSSIAQDFAALVAIFDRQLELVSSADVETRSHLSKAKKAAERGAKLSEKLMGLTQASK